MGVDATAGRAAQVRIATAALTTAAWAACQLCLKPPTGRVPLFWRDRGVGRCTPETAAVLRAHGACPAASENLPALALAGDSWPEVMQIADRALDTDVRAAAGLAEQIQVIDDAGRLIAAAPRGLAVPLGLRMAGVHLVGLVGSGRPARAPATLLLARRAARQSSHPGYLDTLAGGVRRYGESASACLCREAWEEAGLPDPMLRTGRTFGAVSFDLAVPGGYARGRAVLAVLGLPPGYRPQPLDGTVSAFQAMAVAPGPGPAGLRGAPPFKPTAALAAVACLQRTPARAAFSVGELGKILSAAEFRAWPPRPIQTATGAKAGCRTLGIG